MNPIQVVDSHTGGEPTRVVVSGGPELGRGSMAERLEVFKASHDAFRSEDKALDYRHGIAALQIPTLVIGGTVDFLAPPDLTREYFDLLTTPVRQLELFGRSYGHSAEYGHDDQRALPDPPRVRRTDRAE